jgi:four helix bundle protein
MKNYNGYKDLIVYQKAFELSVRIFELTLKFPVEEKYSLTDQIRRASRSVGANIAEAWPKRIYPKSFVSKLVDSQAESVEVNHWLDLSLEHSYIDKEQYSELNGLNIEIQKMLNSMIKNPEKFTRKRNK